MSAEPARPQGLYELLRFYADAGVDEPVLDEPMNWIEAGRRAALEAETTGRAVAAPAQSQRAAVPERPAATPRSPETAPAAAVPDEAQAARARELARSAGSLDALREMLASFQGCNLRFTARNLVFADGNPRAPVMFVGEAPGREEDLEGLPFVGPSGRLLDKMLAAIGLDRSGAYIANVIPWRPPGNRTPTPLETEICRPFLERQIELVNPKVLVTLGGPSAKVILKVTEGVMRLRGKWHAHSTLSGLEIPAMPTLHPAYLLRNPAHKKLAWRDLLEIKARLRSLS
jgi:uracil-DNA glycosylase